MNTPKHTPLPWGIERTEHNNWIGPMRQDGVKVDAIAFTNERGPMFRPDAGERADADAELLVRAVNSHDELVAALLGLVTLIRTSRVDDGSTWTEDDARAFANAEEALKKAGAL